VHVFHTVPHDGLSVCGPYTIPVNISTGMVGYHPTTIMIELRRFTGSHKASKWSVQLKCSFKVPLWTVLNQHRQELPPWSSKYPQTTPRPSYPKILHFPLVTQSGLKFKSSSNSLPNFYFYAIRVKGSSIWVGPTTRLLPLARTKHSTICTYTIRQQG
jgi:hypothetical protein